jgi:hypothetical protein
MKPLQVRRRPVPDRVHGRRRDNQRLAVAAGQERKPSRRLAEGADADVRCLVLDQGRDRRRRCRDGKRQRRCQGTWTEEDRRDRQPRHGAAGTDGEAGHRPRRRELTQHGCKARAGDGHSNVSRSSFAETRRARVLRSTRLRAGCSTRLRAGYGTITLACAGVLSPDSCRRQRLSEPSPAAQRRRCAGWGRLLEAPPIRGPNERLLVSGRGLRCLRVSRRAIIVA